MKRSVILVWMITVVCLSIALPAMGLERIVVSTPGPHALSFLPIDLIPRIGADRAQGVELNILYTASGATALHDLVTRNADFAVAGASAAMSARSNGNDVVVIAPLDDVPIFVLMVRSGLRDQVRHIADLRGKVIAVNTSAFATDTASRELTELLLAANGVTIDWVHLVPTGQNWRDLSALMLSGAADAALGNEPFATRLQRKGVVFFLATTTEPAIMHTIKGAHFLHAALETRNELIAQTPEKVAKMVRMLKESLNWLAHHTPEQVVDTLGVTDPD